MTPPYFSHLLLATKNGEFAKNILYKRIIPDGIDASCDGASQVMFAPTKLGICYDVNRISEVKPDGHAGAKGVKVGWIIKAVNGAEMPRDAETIKSNNDKSVKAGQSFTITFLVASALPLEVSVCARARHLCSS